MSTFDPELTTIQVRRAIAGDPESLSWIVRRFTPLLRAQARYRLGAELGVVCDPDDVVGDVWVRVLPRLGELTPEQRYTPALVSFLSRAILHQINNLFRKALRRRQLGGGPGGATGESLREEIATERSEVGSRLMQRERSDAVHEALERLSESDREVLVLRGIEQLPNQVAAAMIGIEPDTLATRYHRALKRLRRELPGSVFEELGADSDARASEAGSD